MLILNFTVPFRLSPKFSYGKCESTWYFAVSWIKCQFAIYSIDMAEYITDMINSMNSRNHVEAFIKRKTGQ